MFKKFFVGALTAVMLMGFGAFTEATQFDTENICCRGYCYQNCDDDSGNGGEYCGRYGCGQGNYRGGR